MQKRDYHRELVDKQFQNVERTSRHNARKRNTKRIEVSKVRFITTFNPVSYPVLKILLKNTFSICTQMKF